MTSNEYIARTARWPIAAILTGILLSTMTWGHDSDNEIERRCPEAAREQASFKRQLPRRVAAITRPALQKQLLQMQQLDQDARHMFIPAMDGATANDDPHLVYLRQVDATNLLHLKHIINQDGFPTIAMVGVNGVDAAFLLAQHADEDPAFQEKILNVITQRLRSREVDVNAYALLTDRVLRAKGKPQRYGTQFEKRDNDWKAQPIADESQVDARRHALGLMSLANYACIIHAVYGRPTSGN